MKLSEIVEAAKATHPKLFNGLDEKRAAHLASALLGAAGKQIAETADGRIDLEGLGRFIVKKVEVTKDGKKVERKRIVFKPVFHGDARKAVGARKRMKGPGTKKRPNKAAPAA
jgi:hypothetical protein